MKMKYMMIVETESQRMAKLVRMKAILVVFVQHQHHHLGQIPGILMSHLTQQFQGQQKGH